MLVNLKDFEERLKEEFDHLKRLNFISEQSLSRYQDFGVHSIIQYCIIKAGMALGLIAIPEYKIKLKKGPIDKHGIDERFRGRKIRFQRQVRVDVAFARNGQIIGLSEIFTPDEIHGVLRSRELEEPWVTPRHKLEHVVDELKNSLKFMIIVNMFNVLPPWRDARRYTTGEWKMKWIDFIGELGLRSGVQVMHVIINDIDNIEYRHYASMARRNPEI